MQKLRSRKRVNSLFYSTIFVPFSFLFSFLFFFFCLLHLGKGRNALLMKQEIAELAFCKIVAIRRSLSLSICVCISFCLYVCILFLSFSFLIPFFLIFILVFACSGVYSLIPSLRLPPPILLSFSFSFSA